MMVRAQELCESRGGRPGLPVPNKPTVSVAVKQHFNQQIVGQKGKKCVLSSSCPDFQFFIHNFYLLWISRSQPSPWTKPVLEKGAEVAPLMSLR